MKQLALIAAALFCQSAFAESWLCISEAAAGVTQARPFESVKRLVGAKWLVSIDPNSNAITVSLFGHGDSGLDCIEREGLIVCDHPQSVFHGFVLEKESRSFAATNQMENTDNAVRIWVPSGSCETL